MTDSVVKTGLKKSMGAKKKQDSKNLWVQKQWEDYFVMLSPEWSEDLLRIYYGFADERGFLQQHD